MKKEGIPRTFYEQYQEPTVEWLNEKLNGIKLGWLKASEMEIYLAYIQMYSRQHLHRSPYDIADLYGYTESKVAKLQIEFARRFKKDGSEDDLKFRERIFRSMFSQNNEEPLIKVSSDAGKLCFSVTNASDVRRIRRIAAKEGLLIGNVVNNTEFSLILYVFASLFMVCDTNFKKRMEKYVKREGMALSDVFPTTGQLITRAGIDIIKNVSSSALVDLVGGILQKGDNNE
jgi:hypothetical protein